jgi:hypothetical protein
LKPTFHDVAFRCDTVPQTAIAGEPPAQAPDEKEAIRKGLSYVEQKSLSWLHERKCASCHHLPMMVWAQRDARLRGFTIDEKGLEEATEFLLAADNRAGVVPKPDEQERPGNPYSLVTFCWRTRNRMARGP